MNVKERADAVGTFRSVNVRLMEMLAAWIPSTPEMEVKVLMGRHLWLFAQMADRLGKRARELRAPMHYVRAPDPAFAAALDCLAAMRPTAARLEGLYGLALDAMAGAYSAYVAATDPVMDEPTVVIVEDALRDIGRMRAERARLVADFPAIADAGSALDEPRRAFAAARGPVAAQAESQPA